MKKRDIKMDYRGWLFRDKVPLITKDKMWKKYFDTKFGDIDIDVDSMTEEIKDTVETTIENGLNNGLDTMTEQVKETVETTIENSLNTGFESKLCGVHKHIEDAKNHICCDICHAKKDIKQHVNNKFEAINFEEQFSNLNEQAEIIINKLNEL